MNKKNLKLLIIIIIIAIIGFALYKIFFNDPIRVVPQTVETKNEDINIIVTATGKLRPIEQVEVGTQVSGVVEKIYVDYNSSVTKGQLLAELDKNTLNEAVIQSQANLNSALNEQNFYQQNYNRQSNLYNEGVISKADFEQATYQMNNAKQLVIQRRSDLEKSRTNLSYANIYSPIDGVIVSKAVDVGQTVASSFNTPTLFTIAKDLTKMQVEASVDEADIGQIEESMRVSFTVDAFPSEIFEGVVKQIRLNANTESSVVTYTVVITADNDNLKLKPGLTATVTIFVNELSKTLAISAKALSFVMDQTALESYCKQEKFEIPEIKKSSSTNKYVWVQTEKGLEQKAITTGANDGVNIQILNGLKLNEKAVYDLKEIKKSEQKKEGASPFMPKRKGGNKRPRQ